MDLPGRWTGARSSGHRTRCDTKHAVLFGDLTGTFYALEAETGRQLWKKRIEEHEAALLTGSPVVYQGNVYKGHCVLGRDPRHQPRVPLLQFSRKRGRAARERRSASLEGLHHQRRTASHRQNLHRHHPPRSFGRWNLVGAHHLDPNRGALYVTTGDNYSAPSTTTSDAVVALDLASGRMLWSRQVTPGDVFNSGCVSRSQQGPKIVPTRARRGLDYDFGSSAILVKAPKGRDLLIAGQKSGMVYALNPDRKGEIVWTRRVAKGGTIGGVQWGMASDGQNVYAAVSDAYFFTRGPSRGARSRSKPGGLTALHVAEG